MDGTVGGTDLSSVPIDFLGLSNRAYNTLRRAGIYNLRDLTGMSAQELLRQRGVGREVMANIRRALAKYGLSLRGEELAVSPEETIGSICSVLGRIASELSRMSADMREWSEKISAELELAADTLSKASDRASWLASAISGISASASRVDREQNGTEEDDG